MIMNYQRHRFNIGNRLCSVVRDKWSHIKRNPDNRMHLSLSIDTVKTRLQVSGHTYTGPLNAFSQIIRQGIDFTLRAMLVTCFLDLNNCWPDFEFCTYFLMPAGDYNITQI